ncbi:hypothetical protein BDZ89DRAFT_1022100 [Hymenopellis radicata]|nr:hypothetical protein BDZ89DRAFT_1022100 [Hymenopellis radicata]
MDARYIDIAAETRGRHLVGIKPRDFLDEFLPWNASTEPFYRNWAPKPEQIASLKSVPVGNRTEHDMYPKYIEAFEGWCTSGKFTTAATIATKFASHSENGDPNCRYMAVDIGHYLKADCPPSATAFDRMQSQVELKPSGQYDPFKDIDDGEAAESQDKEEGDADKDEPIPENMFPAENPTDKGTHTRGQICVYAATTMTLMFRSHLFTVVLFGSFARLIRWDRRGSIVTRRFDYTKPDEEGQPLILFEFYKRFAQLTAVQRGLDPTVTPLGEDDPRVATAREKFRLYAPDMLYCDARAELRDPGPASQTLYLMTVEFEEGKKREFIIPAPKFHWGCISPFCRSTRRSLAYDPAADSQSEQDSSEKETDGCDDAFSNENASCAESSASRDSISSKKPFEGIFFMKDYWREPSTRTKPEADIYRLLVQHKVSHVAKMETGGDVVGLVTRTQERQFLKDSQVLPDGRSYHHLSRPLQCHRIFLRTVARDLTVFGNCRTLVMCVADAMKAAQEAFDRARILHRDISVGNIMIAPGNRGVLIDWDLCLVLDSDVTTHRPGRTGTWQFVSVHLLMGRGTGHDDAGKQTVTHSVIDDRESAFWVLLYVALRYLKQNLSKTQLYDLLNSCFDASSLDSHHRDMGASNMTKLSVLNLWANAPRRGVIFEIQELNDLLHELAKSLAFRYVDAEETSPRHQRVYESLLKVFGPDSDEVQTNGYFKYLTAKNNMEHDSSWFHETLRAHATKIPLPTKADTLDEHINAF